MNFQYYVSKFAVNKGCIRLPIDKIDGVDVAVFMEHHEMDCVRNCERDYAVMKLEIHIKGIFSQTTSKYIKNEADFEKYFDELLHLKFDKMKGDFVDGRVEQIPFEFYSRLISPNLTLTYQDCCVCLEKTGGRTKCNHAICGICISKLKKTKCPLCRACIEPECESDCESDSDDE
jgi:hypothetical protein